MVCDWPGGYHLYRDRATCRVADEIGLALLPAGPAGVSAAYGGCHSFAIPRTSRNPRAGAELLRFLTSFDAQLGEARRGAIPCRVERARARARRSGGQSSRRGPLAAPGRDRSHDDRPAALRRLPAVRRCDLARRAAGDDWRMVARAGGRASCRGDAGHHRTRAGDDRSRTAGLWPEAAPVARDSSVGPRSLSICELEPSTTPT